ncbi:hypothetical protein V5P93_004297 [Actinokineospora auranticolor]|uniref:hypothetical protein n=1 Tax=Actinokineospora auranticolor TaxID=155976 RepID=UPI000CEC1748|nr:hypothetical protein [Actinokineospora auranticolor]
MHKLTEPVLVMAHGALRDKVAPVRAGAGKQTESHRYGTSAQDTVHAGRAIAVRQLLAHDDQVAAYNGHHEAVRESLRVVGDPVVDQLLAELHLRAEHRAALGVRPDQRLVLVTSTGCAHNLWLDQPGLMRRLVTELPSDRYRVVGVLHPNIWHSYGKQVEHVLHDAL